MGKTAEYKESSINHALGAGVAVTGSYLGYARDSKIYAESSQRECWGGATECYRDFSSTRILPRYARWRVA